MVHMADHRHDTGNRATLGNRLGDENRQMRIPGKVARATNPIHHSCAADMGGVDVAVEVELQRRIDGDDAQAAYYLGVVGNFLGAQNQLVLVRSEEHTSELQSLMRISYAVFC